MIKVSQKIASDSAPWAVALAQDFIAFLANDEDRLMRFLALSGIGPGDLRNNLSEPGFLGFILDFVMQDEELIVAFAADRKIAPEDVLRARAKLPGANLDF